MGAAPRACRTCVWFRRGQHKWSKSAEPNRYFSDCDKKRLPTHANCSACAEYERAKP